MQSFLSYLTSEDTAHGASEEVEAALALLLSLSHNEAVVDELVKAYYPFMAFKTDTGDVYFDLLLLSEAEKTQTASFDVSKAVAELVESHDDERDTNTLRCKSMISTPGLETIQISGLVNDQRIPQFLKRAKKVEYSQLALFKPQLTQKRFKSIKEKISVKEEERQALLKEINHAREDIQAFIKKVEEENKEKIESYIDESSKRMDEQEKENNKILKEAENGLIKSCKELNKAYDYRANEITEELEYIQNSQKELEGGNWETRRRRLENELKTRQLSRQLESLEKERTRELMMLEKATEKTKEELRAHLIEEEAKEKHIADKLEENAKSSLEKIKEISNLLGNLEKRIYSEKEYLARLLELKYKEGGHIRVPFYIHKSDNVYGCHTPQSIENTGGVKRTLKLMLAENLKQKILQHIKPETESISELMENLVTQLSDESKLGKEYKNKLGEENLLVSRSMLDKIEVGLYKLFEWEWINEKDYMIAQRCLVEKMDNLNGGNIFQRKPDPITETPLQQEIPV